MWCPAVVKCEWELDYGQSPHAYVNQRLQIQLELLMMSGMPLETCWVVNERWNNKICYKVAPFGYFYWVILRCTDSWILKSVHFAFAKTWNRERRGDKEFSWRCWWRLSVSGKLHSVDCKIGKIQRPVVPACLFPNIGSDLPGDKTHSNRRHESRQTRCSFVWLLN